MSLRYSVYYDNELNPSVAPGPTPLISFATVQNGVYALSLGKHMNHEIHSAQYEDALADDTEDIIIDNEFDYSYE